MLKLQITSLTAAVLALWFVFLSSRVIAARASGNASLGDTNPAKVSAGEEGRTAPLFLAIRGHSNFAEYVPLCLILMALIEVQGGARALLWSLGGVLVLARVLHPFGLGRKAPNPQRFLGAALTLAVLVVAALYVIWLVL
jgi:hypothetical protein